MPWLEDGFRDGRGAGQARRVLTGFRGELYRCLTGRADALFELADAVLCRPQRVHMLAELSLELECRRGHGAVYDAVSCGEIQFARLRRALAALARRPGRTAGSGSGCRRQQLAAAGRGDQPGTTVPVCYIAGLLSVG
jgi:hypothetical protein